MKVFLLKDISSKISTRDDGTQAAIRLFELLMSSEMIEYRKEILPDGSIQVSLIRDPDGAVIEIPENSGVSTSFLDEVIYRLAEQNQLRHFRFQIHDERIYKKFVLASTRHKVPIDIIYNDENQTIEPSSEPSQKEVKIIFKDL